MPIINTKLLAICALLSNMFMTNALAVTKDRKPWIRVDSTLNHIKTSPKKGRYVAYSDAKQGALYILDLKTRNKTLVTKKYVNGSFVWSPDGIRLIYREQSKKANNTVTGELKIFDIFLKKNITIAEVNSQSGFLSFDPRDYKLLLMHENGIMQKSVKLPDSRLAKWQMRMSSQKARWVVGDNGVVSVSASGKSMVPLKDDGSGVESFSISPDGSKIAWATKRASIFIAEDGKEPKFLDYGKDPKWSPNSQNLIYAGAHLIGKKVAGFDLKIADENQNFKWVTRTPVSHERWPEFLPNGSIIYTKSSSTDLYTMELKTKDR